MTHGPNPPNGPVPPESPDVDADPSEPGTDPHGATSDDGDPSPGWRRYGRRMATTTVYLRPDQMRRLRALAARTRRPMSTFIRDGIDSILADHENDSDDTTPE